MAVSISAWMFCVVMLFGVGFILGYALRSYNRASVSVPEEVPTSPAAAPEGVSTEDLGAVYELRVAPDGVNACAKCCLVPFYSGGGSHSGCGLKCYQLASRYHSQDFIDAHWLQFYLSERN